MAWLSTSISDAEGRTLLSSRDKDEFVKMGRPGLTQVFSSGFNFTRCDSIKQTSGTALVSQKQRFGNLLSKLKTHKFDT